jgi:hypothetical protein
MFALDLGALVDWKRCELWSLHRRLKLVKLRQQLSLQRGG